MALVVKTAVDPRRSRRRSGRPSAPSIREQPIARMRTMDDWLSRSLQPRRAPMTLIAIFGAVALVLSAIGIYGVLAFGVAQRVREFGIRQALGADRASILSLVLTQGLRTAGAGDRARPGRRARADALPAVAALRRAAPHDVGVFARRGGPPVRRRAGWPATSPPAAPRASTRWSRCAILRGSPASSALQSLEILLDRLELRSSFAPACSSAIASAARPCFSRGPAQGASGRPRAPARLARVAATSISAS